MLNDDSYLTFRYICVFGARQYDLLESERLLGKHLQNTGILGGPLSNHWRNCVQHIHANLEIAGEIAVMNGLVVGNAVATREPRWAPDECQAAGVPYLCTDSATVISVK